jgi:hypothetical protein
MPTGREAATKAGCPSPRTSGASTVPFLWILVDKGKLKFAAGVLLPVDAPPQIL